MDEEEKPVDFDHIWEMSMDLERGTQCLEPAAAKRVNKARDALVDVFAMLTTHVPSDSSAENYAEHVWKLCKSGLMFRNVIRAEFAESEGRKLPPEFERWYGEPSDGESIH